MVSRRRFALSAPRWVPVIIRDSLGGKKIQYREALYYARSSRGVQQLVKYRLPVKNLCIDLMLAAVEPAQSGS